ncbi:hypothetical protein ADUPG1_000003 [Aduncisulcus paluster]|uniref:Uncharacterized protein n=1 Tax=Aduncisulcus paluster TaxID=2918883 RepID=A0ABQ5K428_9EUKA|nr:hypothetical protein ADUPG1_000003 [Aduncisulcus paluster]
MGISLFVKNIFNIDGNIFVYSKGHDDDGISCLFLKGHATGAQLTEEIFNYANRIIQSETEFVQPESTSEESEPGSVRASPILSVQQELTDDFGPMGDTYIPVTTTALSDPVKKHCPIPIPSTENRGNP